MCVPLAKFKLKKPQVKFYNTVANIKWKSKRNKGNTNTGTLT